MAGAVTLNDSVKATRTGGTIILIGNVTGNVAELFLPMVLTRRLTLQSVSVGSKQAFEAMNRSIGLHGLRPIVGRTFGFENIADAFQALEAQSEFGNICIEIG